MRALGIDKDSGLTYIGDMWSKWVRTNDPLIPVAVLVNAKSDLYGPDEKTSLGAQYVFQEISFDAATGIRRGYVWRQIGRAHV